MQRKESHIDHSNISNKQANRIKQKGTWFVGTTHDVKDIVSIKEHITEFPFYAFIIHDKDEGKTDHIHFVFNLVGSRSIKSVCETLGCSYQDVQVANRPRGSIRYLIHADDKDKYQYSLDKVFTNNNDRLEYYFKSFTYTINDLFTDMSELQNHHLTLQQFIEKYNSEFSTMPFYQKVRVINDLKIITRF